MIKTVKIKDKTYNIAKLSARMQNELLSIVGKRLAAASVLVDESPDFSLLVRGVLLDFAVAELEHVADIVLSTVVEHGSSDRLSIDTWQHGAVAWHELVTAAIVENLEDFCDWLDSIRG